MEQIWWILTEGRLEPFNGTNNFIKKLTANCLYFLDGKLVCYMFLLLQFHHTTGSDFPLNGGYSFHFCWENFLFKGCCCSIKWFLFLVMLQIVSFNFWKLRENTTIKTWATTVSIVLFCFLFHKTHYRPTIT